MHTTLSDQITQSLRGFSNSARLYALTLGSDDSALLVEAFSAVEGVQQIGVRDVIVLSTSIDLALDTMLGQSAALQLRLANGSRCIFSGEINQVALLGSDGGLARYRIRLVPWLWRLSQVRNSRVWQEKSVIEIVDTVLRAYQPSAQWCWSADARSFMARALVRSYCCQYRETDFDFVARLLSEEGLGWRFEQRAEGLFMLLFADSTYASAMPEDPSSADHGGIDYHAASALAQQDTLQLLRCARTLQASLVTLSSHDYKAKRAVSASSPSLIQRPARLPELEVFDTPGQYAYANSQQARRYADLQMEALEARTEGWQGRSTLRTLRAGTHLRVNGAPRTVPLLNVLSVTSVGVNNLPSAVSAALTELFGPVPELLSETLVDVAPDEMAALFKQAMASGYANCFEALPQALPWRPAQHAPERPTASGSQSAIVVGADGSARAQGRDELYCDRLGRVRIRFHWQAEGERASCWVRVAQRSAGAGMGSQFLPRIGQEVLVQFLENDIDRPIIVGALYNGQGEGGRAPTPGGRAGGASTRELFSRAHDHAIAAQGNLAAGNSPVWHGASGDLAGHNNGAAQSGIRSKEFGGRGYNQLLFDDTDAQGRIQLKCSQAATELNLGHLIHTADNYRGSFRGLGAELRTDAYGAIRAGAGLLVTSYASAHRASERDPAGANDAGVSLLRQALKQMQVFSAAATSHHTVALAAQRGSISAAASVADASAAPLSALLTALSAQLDADPGQLPQLGAPLIAIAAAAGFGASAGQSLQLANGDTISLISGADTEFVSGGQLRVHSGQALGVLGGAVQAGPGGRGVQLIAAQDSIEVQAQADQLSVQARDAIDVISANAHIDWAAAKRISLSTAGGANITIAGGNITVQCPGKIKVHAGKKSFVGPDRLTYDLPALPGSICIACLNKSIEAGLAFTMVE